MKKAAPQAPPGRDVEGELDSLIEAFKDRRRAQAAEPEAAKPDPIQLLRKLIVSELVGVFLELNEKYAEAGVSMEMDVSNFLASGREINFEFALGEFRTQLHGTVTTEAIAFHEIRHAPDMRGELTGGPMLRLRHLNASTFREFLCGRLTILLRTALRR